MSLNIIFEVSEKSYVQWGINNNNNHNNSYNNIILDCLKACFYNINILRNFELQLRICVIKREEDVRAVSKR